MSKSSLTFPLPAGTKVRARTNLYGVYEVLGRWGYESREYVAVKQGTVGTVQADGMLLFPTRSGCPKNEPEQVDPWYFEGPATTYEVVE